MNAMRLLPDGQMLAATHNWPGGPPRPNENSSLVWLVDEDGRVRRELLRVNGPESLIRRDQETSTRLNAPFQRRPTFVFGPDGSLLVGNTGHGSFARYVGGERLAASGTIDLRLPQTPVTRQDRTRWADSVRTDVQEQMRRAGADERAAAGVRGRVESMISSARYPATHTAYSVAVLADDGNLWVQLHEPRRRGGSRWQVHDPRTGALIRALDVPTTGGVKSAAVHDGALFVIEIGEDDVSRIAKYVPARAGATRR